MCGELVIAIISVCLFIISETIPKLKLKCCDSDENKIASVHELLKELTKKLTQRNLNIRAADQWRLHAIFARCPWAAHVAWCPHVCTQGNS